MGRAQFLTISLGASLGVAIAVAGGVLIWRGAPPGGQQPQSQSPQEIAPLIGAQPAPKPQAEKPANPQSAGLPPVPAAPPEMPPAPPPSTPQFDTVRVEPSGDTVVAGHAAPNAKIDLMNGQESLGKAQADDSGDFVIIPQRLTPGTYVLGLRSTDGKAAPVISRQTVTVAVPEKGKKGLVVALTEPGKPSKILADPTAETAPTAPASVAQKPAETGTSSPSPSGAAPAHEAKAEQSQAEQGQPTAPPEAGKAPAAAASPNPPPTSPRVAIKTAEVDKGGFYAAGFAPPGTRVRIYLNGSALANVTADAQGQWSLTIGKGMVPGHYTIRADALDAKGQVIARAEVPFDVPVAVAQVDEKPAGAKDGANDTEKPAPNTAAPASPSPTAPADTSAAAPAPVAHAVVPQIATATVSPGDSLWRISRKTLGQGIRYTLIYQANAKQIRDPDLIYPGQVFVVPHVD